MPVGPEDRQYWIKTLDRIARPVLTALSQRRLRATMPVEAARPQVRDDRAKVTHLEALGRTLTGISPWLELGPADSPEGKLRAELADLSRRSIDAGTDPQSPDYMNFKIGGQPLVDAAFLAHAIVRAPNELWKKLDDRIRGNVLAALKLTRAVKPGENNWTLFAAMVEAAIHRAGEEIVPTRIEYAFKRHMEWYKGDGIYGDGAMLHWDYYNSFVIQPMLIDCAEVFSGKLDFADKLRPVILDRARRYAAIQERLIAPDGSFPPIGRSLCYRFGAFQLLAQMTLRRDLPRNIAPGQVRSALTAVIRRTMEAPGAFDKDGWLTLGFAGHQPAIAETYISTGSVYLCCAGLLPLGLPPEDELWTCGETAWTGKQIWAGENISADHAMADKIVTM
ncbi:MAG: DUF2264 domain-containing protein [Tepidisphaerales bacterium]